MIRQAFVFAEYLQAPQFSPGCNGCDSIFTITSFFYFTGIQEKNRGRQEGVPEGTCRVQSQPGFQGNGLCL